MTPDEREVLKVLITYILDQDVLSCACTVCDKARDQLRAFAEAKDEPWPETDCNCPGSKPVVNEHCPVHGKKPEPACQHIWNTTLPKDNQGGFFITCEKCGADSSISLVKPAPKVTEEELAGEMLKAFLLNPTITAKGFADSAARVAMRVMGGQA